MPAKIEMSIGITNEMKDSVMAFDLGGSNVKMWFNEREDVIPSETDLSSSNEKTILEYLKQWISMKKGIKVVSIALPCTMLAEKGAWRILPTTTKFARLTEGEHVGIIGKMEKAWEKQLKIKVFILGDGEAASIDVFFQMQHNDSLKDYKNIVVITIGTSIGAGYILNGYPYIGTYTCRASHIILDPIGDWCENENHRGCWKTLVADNARTKLALNMGLVDPTDSKLIMDSKMIAEIARHGSKKARLYFRLYAENLARGIATIINTIPIECVVIAGGVAKAGDLLLKPLKERLARGDLFDPDLSSIVKIVNINSFSVAHGAQIYALRQQKLLTF